MGKEKTLATQEAFFKAMIPTIRDIENAKSEAKGNKTSRGVHLVWAKLDDVYCQYYGIVKVVVDTIQVTGKDGKIKNKNTYEYQGGDSPYIAIEKLVKAGVLVTRPQMGGLRVFLAGDVDESTSAEELLTKAGLK